MVHKEFCDVCNVEITHSKTHGSFYYIKDSTIDIHSERSVELCGVCAGKVRDFLQKMKDEQSSVYALMKKIGEMKGQETLDKFRNGTKGQ